MHEFRCKNPCGENKLGVFSCVDPKIKHVFVPIKIKSVFSAYYYILQHRNIKLLHTRFCLHLISCRPFIYKMLKTLLFS